jgi:hypothetical protein
MCLGSDSPQPVARKNPPPAPPVAPIPDQTAPSGDAVVARQRERRELDAMAGYRSTFASGPRGPGGPTLADQRGQLDVAPPVLTVDDSQRVGPTPVKPPPPGPGEGGGPGGGGSGPGGGNSGGGGGTRVKPFLVAPSDASGGAAAAGMAVPWWQPATGRRNRV